MNKLNAINFSPSFTKYIIQTLEIKQEKCWFFFEMFQIRHFAIFSRSCLNFHFKWPLGDLPAFPNFLKSKV